MPKGHKWKLSLHSKVSNASVFSYTAGGKICSNSLMSKHLSSMRYIFQMLTLAFEEAILVIWKGVLFLKLQYSLSPTKVHLLHPKSLIKVHKKCSHLWKGILWQQEKVKALWLLMQAAIYHFFPKQFCLISSSTWQILFQIVWWLMQGMKN